MPKSNPVHQHYVPKCYLKEFVDPYTPPNYDPYVWIFERDSKKPKKKSPENIFKSTDLYTINIPGKGKNYFVEKTLSGIESEYASIFAKKIKKKLSLDNYEHAILCAFSAAMMQRTLRSKDNMESIYAQLLEKSEEVEALSGLESTQSSEIKAKFANTHGMGIIRVVPKIANILFQMNLMFLCVDGSGEKFITSDDPCNLFNPDLQWQRFESPGLAQKKVQVTMALSPEILVCFSWQTVSGYITVERSSITDINRMIRSNSYKYFISSSPRVRIIWFSRYPLDLWFLIKVLKHKVSLLPNYFRRVYFNWKYNNVRKRKI